MMVGHDINSYAHTLPQPPLSPPMHPKEQLQQQELERVHDQRYRHPPPAFPSSSPNSTATSPLFPHNRPHTAFGSPRDSDVSSAASRTSSHFNHPSHSTSQQAYQPSYQQSVKQPQLSRPSSAMTSTGRPPVRFGLDDPRVQRYMVPSKKASSPTSFGSTFLQPKSAHTAVAVKGAATGAGVSSVPGVGEQGVRASNVTETQRHYGPSGVADPLHTQETRDDRPMRRESINSEYVGTLRQRAGSDGQLTHVMHRRGYGSHDHHEYYDNAQGYGRPASARSAEFSAPSDRISSSTPPSPLPSPSPSLTPMSPDWQVVPHPGQGQRHTQDYGRSHAQHPHQPMNSSSPHCSEMERDADSNGVLFRSSPAPLFTSALQHQRPRHHSDHNLHLPPVINREVNHINNATSRTSTSGPVPAPVMDSRAVTPPASAMAWSSKHHHHRIPVRSPERIGQDVMTTSTTNTESSAYMIMDYYQLYLQNPRALRPEGGRYDERQQLHRATEAAMSASAYDEGHSDAHPTSHTGGLKSKGKSKTRVSATTMNRAVSGSHFELSRRQYMPLILTATGRVLRHEDAKQDMDSRHSAEVVRGLGIQSAGSTSTSTSSSSRPTPMSIHNLLTDDTYYHEDFDSGVVKRKKDEAGDEPKKRQRMSKKRAAELGLLDENGNLITKRKRTKKIHDPDHVSPSGFRHGGERVVQEPDELVILEPDVGPVSMLDDPNHPPPKVIWKGTPLSVKGRPGYEQLHPYEEYVASTLRLSPAQYLSCKQTLILASRQYHANPNGKQFRKSDAQKLCRIDVNKTSRLWEAFAKIGWLEGISEKDI